MYTVKLASTNTLRSIKVFVLPLGAFLGFKCQVLNFNVRLVIVGLF